jgi:DNA-binding GntR family transcriptional regulator
MSYPAATGGAMSVGTRARRIEPVENRTLRDRVTDALRDAITQGVLKPGQRIVERELAADLDVSRLPIREAIRQLEHEGLLISHPRKGTFVVEVSDEDVVEIFSLRTAFESLAIRLVTAHSSPTDVDRLLVLVDAMRDAAAQQHFAALWEIDTEFHTLLCTLANHERLLKHWGLLFRQWQALDSLVDQVHPLEALAADDPLIIAQHQLPEIHQALVDAIASGDPDRAEQAMREHMAIAQRNTLAVKSLADARLKHEAGTSA